MTGTRLLGPPPRRRAEARQDLPCQSCPDLFFAEAPDDIRLAKALCRQCPVQAACLAGAIGRGEPWGVWGGALFERGAVIPDKRPRGRPRKQAAPAAAPRSRLASATAC
jgi:WhiB family transcriptional regulator, redox-sensing transcriptional regulator